jgi:DNA-binding NtrC family response regulator
VDSDDRGGKVKTKILLVDDDPFTQQLFEGLLRREDFELRVAGNIAEARNEFHSIDFNLILLDQRLPDGNGLDFFKEMRALRPQQVAILITGHADLHDAIGAVRGGLFDYLTKPFRNLDELSAIIDRALEMDRAYREISNLQAMLAARPGGPVIVGRSAAMQKLLQQVQRTAPLDTTVLIEGESGTGKELVARQIHELSPRSKARYVGLNCGGLSESLLEATLFGYKKPAFTSDAKVTPGYFEEANGGTLVLDELGELSPKLQSSLLRVLQERTFSRLGGLTHMTSDFRLICTSSTSLADKVKAGDFRSDLYYRINVNLLRVPPLRERREDILSLALLFLDQFNSKFDKKAGPLVPEALAALEAAHWTGNVRELQHVIERAVVVNVRGPIVVADLELGAHDRAAGDHEASRPASFEEARERFERAYFIDLLHSVGGNVSEAARQSHISRQALHRYLKQLGIVTKS